MGESGKKKNLLSFSFAKSCRPLGFKLANIFYIPKFMRFDDKITLDNINGHVRSIGPG